ncbi:hypothetical protein COW46_05415 [Candidatus Gracilibacteria bacterium CG17_big_fil_post_rev_8_21_14_2_50_48_13]|nr:MAG: hypothetical protein COW46_05415 [Candidatus Gracilibacteria bacterium CG17_big_fil_post_rev_8_21_14_2_50_48_13]
MLHYAALFRPIDLFDPSTEILLGYLFVAAIGLVVLKIVLRKKYTAFIEAHGEKDVALPQKKTTEVNKETPILH